MKYIQEIIPTRLESINYWTDYVVFDYFNIYYGLLKYGLLEEAMQFYGYIYHPETMNMNQMIKYDFDAIAERFGIPKNFIERKRIPRNYRETNWAPNIIGELKFTTEEAKERFAQFSKDILDEIHEFTLDNEQVLAEKYAEWGPWVGEEK